MKGFLLFFRCKTTVLLLMRKRGICVRRSSSFDLLTMITNLRIFMWFYFILILILRKLLLLVRSYIFFTIYLHINFIIIVVITFLRLTSCIFSTISTIMQIFRIIITLFWSIIIWITLICHFRSFLRLILLRTLIITMMVDI